MKALSRSLSIDIEQYTELVLLLTRLLYLVITSLINPFYCYMLFSACLYKPQINIITFCLYSICPDTYKDVDSVFKTKAMLNQHAGIFLNS